MGNKPRENEPCVERICQEESGKAFEALNYSLLILLVIVCISDKLTGEMNTKMQVNQPQSETATSSTTTEMILPILDIFYLVFRSKLETYELTQI